MYWSMSTNWMWPWSTNPWGGCGGRGQPLQFGLLVLKAETEQCVCMIGAGARWESPRRIGVRPAGKLGKMHQPRKDKGVGEV